MEPVLNASEKGSGLGGSLGAFGSIISGSEALPIQIKTEDNKGALIKSMYKNNSFKGKYLTNFEFSKRSIKILLLT